MVIQASKATSLLAATLTGLALTLAGCGGGSSSTSGGSSAAMQITSCSLSCSGGAGGTQIACGLNQVAVNEALVIAFSQPVNLATVNKNTFQVTDLATGKSPAGSFTLDPSDPKKLIFRPLLTFDASGAPVFGFEENKSYQVLLRGTVQDSGGNFITSSSGKKNVSRMFCTIVATGILDPVPGAPTVTVDVDVVTETDPVTGDVTAVESFTANQGTLLTDVWSDSRITLTFDDVMNPATLVNPVTKESATLHVYVDPDGNTNDPTDQVEVFGDYTINIDQDALQTTVVFTPSGGLPSSGSGAEPRKIIVDIPSVVSDLGSNPLINAGQVIFVPQFVPFDPVVLPDGTGEQFLTTKYEDSDRTGAVWGEGALLRARGGGGGGLGDLIVSQEDSPVILDTDSQVFDGFDVIPQGSVAFPPSTTPPSVTVTDGVFEFTTIDVRPGGQLLFTGSNPARLFARGSAYVQNSGRIEVSGATPPDQFTTPAGHNSSLLSGGLGGAGGPAGGTGGQGGDRPNDTDPSLLVLLGSANPGADIMGQDASGVGGTGSLGSGLGGSAWPLMPPDTSSDLVGFLPDKVCKIDMVAGPGSGGAYATSGSQGVGSIVDGLLNPVPPTGIVAPNTPGGDAAAVGLTPEIRTLNPDLGHLRGGAGGGGGGASWLRSQTDGFPFGECVVGKKFKVYTPHSAAGGGGGGGALQLQAGELIKVDGNILAQGGNGGDGQTGFASINRDDQASPGGGGSGGALLLQARNLIIADTGGRLDVSGGSGGTGAGGAPGSKGGDGGAGLVRLEAQSTPDPLSEAKKISPFDATPGSITGGETSSVILSTGEQLQGFTGPQGRSGAQSCWIIPDGNFFVLDFSDDDLSDPLNPIYGWDLDVVTTLGLQPFSFRDPTDPANPFGFSPESALGNDFGGGTPGAIVVRFQGVHSNKEIGDICNVDLTDPFGDVDINSLTPWVRHPAELNDYWATALDPMVPGNPELAAKRRPNMIRYQIIFDGNAPFASLVAGVTNFQLKASPD